MAGVELNELLDRSSLSDGRFPELNLVAFGVDDPAELTLLRFFRAVYYVAAFAS